MTCQLIVILIFLILSYYCSKQNSNLIFSWKATATDSFVSLVLSISKNVSYKMLKYQDFFWSFFLFEDRMPQICSIPSKAQGNICIFEYFVQQWYFVNKTNRPYSLTHFMPYISFYTPCKYQKTSKKILLVLFQLLSGRLASLLYFKLLFWPFNTGYPLKGHTYLNKHAAESCAFD